MERSQEFCDGVGKARTVEICGDGPKYQIRTNRDQNRTVTLV